jgi:DNA-binding SARP family transcriptional activator
MTRGIRCRLLGPVSAEADGVPVGAGGTKRRTALAVLLLHANRVVSEEKLIDLLWEGEPPATARAQVQNRIWELRTRLGHNRIAYRPPGYVITIHHGELDLHEFEDAVTEANAALQAGQGRRAGVLLREAVALCDRHLLGGVTEALARQEGPVLEERRTGALEQLFEVELAMGRAASVIGELRRAVHDHPFREQLRAQLMHALHRCGRSHEALTLYADTRQQFIDELGIEPGGPLRRLHARILAG